MRHSRYRCQQGIPGYKSAFSPFSKSTFSMYINLDFGSTSTSSRYKHINQEVKWWSDPHLCGQPWWDGHTSSREPQPLSLAPNHCPVVWRMDEGVGSGRPWVGAHKSPQSSLADCLSKYHRLCGDQQGRGEKGEGRTASPAPNSTLIDPNKCSQTTGRFSGN